MFPVFVLGLSFTNWGVNCALIPDKKVSEPIQRRVLAILAVLLCFAMFTAGAEKATNWIDFDLETGGFLDWFYRGFFNLGRQYLLAPFVLLVPPQAFEAFDYFAVVFELSPIIALLAGKRWWQLWLLVASVFHLGNTLLLNIAFTAHALVYLSFIPLSSFIKTPQMQLSKARVTLFAIAMSAAIAVHHLFYLSSGNSIEPLKVYALPLFESEKELSLYSGLVVWIITVCLTGIAVAKAFNIISDTKSKSSKLKIKS